MHNTIDYHDRPITEESTFIFNNKQYHYRRVRYWQDVKSIPLLPQMSHCAEKLIYTYGIQLKEQEKRAATFGIDLKSFILKASSSLDSTYISSANFSESFTEERSLEVDLAAIKVNQTWIYYQLILLHNFSWSEPGFFGFGQQHERSWTFEERTSKTIIIPTYPEPYVPSKTMAMVRGDAQFYVPFTVFGDTIVASLPGKEVELLKVQGASGSESFVFEFKEDDKLELLGVDSILSTSGSGSSIQIEAYGIESDEAFGAPTIMIR